MVGEGWLGAGWATVAAVTATAEEAATAAS
jgi:hypothetical protein